MAILTRIEAVIEASVRLPGCGARWPSPTPCTPPCVGGGAFAFVSSLICSQRAALCADKRSTCATSAARSSFFVQLPCQLAPDTVLSDVRRVLSVSENCAGLFAAARIFGDGDTTEAIVSTASSVAVVPMSASRIFVPSVSEMHTDVTSSRPTDCRPYLAPGQLAARVCVSGTMTREQKSSSCELMNMNLPSE